MDYRNSIDVFTYRVPSCPGILKQLMHFLKWLHLLLAAARSNNYNRFNLLLFNNIPILLNNTPMKTTSRRTWQQRTVAKGELVFLCL